MLFFGITILSLIGMLYIQYNNNQFFNNPISEELQARIDKEDLKIRKKIFSEYGMKVKFPIKIIEKIPDNLYGLATVEKNGQISIYLNKNRFKESEEYMLNNVLPHEYAHAMMFYFGNFSKKNGGHNKKWQEICLSIGGKKCDRFVKYHDILMGKLRF